MTSPLYSKEDNQQLDKDMTQLVNTQALIKSTETPPEETLATPIPEGLPTNIHQILNHINSSRKNVQYFTHTKGKVKFDIDKTILEPSVATALSGKNFEKAYNKQLNAIVYTNDEELNVLSLMQLVSLYQIIEKGLYPINLVSAKHKRKIIPIIVALNAFFNTNHQVISGIYNMMSTQSVTPKQQP